MCGSCHISTMSSIKNQNFPPDKSWTCRQPIIVSIPYRHINQYIADSTPQFLLSPNTGPYRSVWAILANSCHFGRKLCFKFQLPIEFELFFFFLNFRFLIISYSPKSDLLASHFWHSPSHLSWTHQLGPSAFITASDKSQYRVSALGKHSSPSLWQVHPLPTRYISLSFLMEKTWIGEVSWWW